MLPATLTLEPDVKLPEIAGRRMSLQDCQSPNKEVSIFYYACHHPGCSYQYHFCLYSDMEMLDVILVSRSKSPRSQTENNSP